ncbi:MAG TPA: hypothetical protein VGI28_05505 [Stellaceae bacterium]|jgi:hypothetical protein
MSCKPGESAVRAEGKSMPTGHFLPEQLSQQLVEEVATFLGS